MKRLSLTKDALVDSIKFNVDRLSDLENLTGDKNKAMAIANDLRRIADEITYAVGGLV